MNRFPLPIVSECDPDAPPIAGPSPVSPSVIPRNGYPRPPPHMDPAYRSARRNVPLVCR